jgi:hypothetical protein
MRMTVVVAAVPATRSVPAAGPAPGATATVPATRRANERGRRQQHAEDEYHRGQSTEQCEASHDFPRV